MPIVTTPAQPKMAQANSTQGHTPAHVLVSVNVQPQVSKQSRKSKPKVKRFQRQQDQFGKDPCFSSMRQHFSKDRNNGSNRHRRPLSEPHTEIQWASSKCINKNGNPGHKSGVTMDMVTAASNRQCKAVDILLSRIEIITDTQFIL